MLNLLQKKIYWDYVRNSQKDLQKHLNFGPLSSIYLTKAFSKWKKISNVNSNSAFMLEIVDEDHKISFWIISGQKLVSISWSWHQSLINNCYNMNLRGKISYLFLFFYFTFSCLEDLVCLVKMLYLNLLEAHCWDSNRTLMCRVSSHGLHSPGPVSSFSFPLRHTGTHWVSLVYIVQFHHGS